MTSSRRSPALVALLCLSLAAGCRSSGRPEAGPSGPACRILGEGFDPASLFDFEPVFCEDDSGSGHFGAWTLDDRGLPAYRYDLDQTVSPLGPTFNTEGDLTRTRHWHGFGNDRVIGLAHNDGTVELFNTDRGYKYLNKVDEESGNHGGGWAYIDDGGDLFGTFYQPGLFDRYERLFAMGGFRVTAERGGLRSVRRTFAPVGDEPVVATEVTLANLTGRTKRIRHYELWDVNLWQMLPMPLASGELLGAARRGRREFNGSFETTSRYDPASGVLSVSFEPTCLVDPPALDSDGLADYRLPEVFLALPGVEAAYHTTDGPRFFGEGGPARPAGIDAAGGVLYEGSAAGMPPVLVLGHDIVLPPGGEARFTTLFGHVSPASERSSAEIVAGVRDAGVSWVGDGRRRLDQGAYIAVADEGWLTRELAWHGDALLGLASYEEPYGTHLVGQHGAYTFLMGLQGAVRDFALTTIPLILLRPDLAADTLRYAYRMTYEDGQIGYSNLGLRTVTGFGVHDESSDLDIFLLWMLSEYLDATKDLAHLREPAPYYPHRTGTTDVLHHAATALDHLEHTVGFGANGMLRMLDGDWNDGIILRSPTPEHTRRVGESAFNTAFACYLMPKVADTLEAAGGRAALLADRARRIGERARAGLEGAWAGEWYLRGTISPTEPIGDDQLFIEPQLFALLSDVPDRDRRERIVEAIHERLDRPSPIGALIVDPPSDQGSAVMHKGWDINGGTWAALNGLLVWAYGTVSPAYSFLQFEKSSLRRHASVYPDCWYGIWTGPDTYNAHYADRPGEAPFHAATAISDFPAMNSNHHALPLLAAFKALGWTPRSDGIEIRPLWVQRPFLVKTPLAGWAYSEDGAAFYYRAERNVSRTLRIALPDPTQRDPVVFVDGRPVEAEVDEGTAVIPLRCRAGRMCRVVIR